MGARLHIPHGRINAMLLPYVIEFNAGLADEDASPACQAAAKKYARLAQLIGAGGMSVRSGVKNFVREIMKLEKALNMPQSFASCGANPTRQDKVVIARFALSDGCFATTPRKASESQVVDILNKLDAAGR